MTMTVDAGTYRFPVERATLEEALASISDEIARDRLTASLENVPGEVWHVSVLDGDVILDAVSRVEREEED